MEKPKYYDIREDFWRKHFDLALDYDAFLEDSPDVFAQKWKAAESSLPALTPEQASRLKGHNRKLNVLVYCAAWCGDCVRQMPMVRKIFETAGPDIRLKLIDREESDALRDELRILGAMRVPVTVFLTEDFHEVGRIGDRMLTTYRRKRAKETGEACDAGILPPPGEELAAELGEWVDYVERMLIMARLAPPLRERHGD